MPDLDHIFYCFDAPLDLYLFLLKGLSRDRPTYLLTYLPTYVNLSTSTYPHQHTCVPMSTYQPISTYINIPTYLCLSTYADLIMFILPAYTEIQSVSEKLTEKKIRWQHTEFYHKLLDFFSEIENKISEYYIDIPLIKLHFWQ